MRMKHASILIGAALLGVGALALPAVGKDPAVHELTFQLPGGGTETIRYTGSVAPKVSFVPAPSAIDWFTPISLGFSPSFAMIDQIAADMDRQMDAFWRRADQMASWPTEDMVSQAALQSLGPNGSSYSVISESFGNNVCTRMTEITALPNGGKPKVVSRTSGNCEASPSGTAVSSDQFRDVPIAAQGTIPAAAVLQTAL